MLHPPYTVLVLCRTPYRPHAVRRTAARRTAVRRMAHRPYGSTAARRTAVRRTAYGSTMAHFPGGQVVL
eukprot:gene9951-biopygen2871